MGTVFNCSRGGHYHNKAALAATFSLAPTSMARLVAVFALCFVFAAECEALEDGISRSMPNTDVKGHDVSNWCEGSDGGPSCCGDATEKMSFTEAVPAGISEEECQQSLVDTNTKCLKAGSSPIHEDARCCITPLATVNYPYCGDDVLKTCLDIKPVSAVYDKNEQRCYLKSKYDADLERDKDAMVTYVIEKGDEIVDDELSANDWRSDTDIYGKNIVSCCSGPGCDSGAAYNKFSNPEVEDGGGSDEPTHGEFTTLKFDGTQADCLTQAQLLKEACTTGTSAMCGDKSAACCVPDTASGASECFTEFTEAVVYDSNTKLCYIKRGDGTASAGIGLSARLLS